MENYFRDESFRFNISVSDKCYDHKPTSEDYKGMSFSLVVGITVEGLLDFIKKGHSFCHVFDGNIRKKMNFLYTYSVFVDVDNSNESMHDFINQCAIKPTIAYTTSSNGLQGKGFRYRLIYIFDGIIDNEVTYKFLYNCIVDINGLGATKDNCGSVSNQLMNGNSKNDIEIFCSYYIYHINALIFSKCSLEYTPSPSLHYYSKEQSEKNETAPDHEPIIMGDDSNEVNKMINLLLKDTKAFLSVYKEEIDIISESKIDFNEEGYGFYPEDYYCLFCRFNWQEKKVIKFKDHEKRRNRLYIDTCIMRLIKPDATFQELLYNLVVRRQRYYDNSDGVLDNQFLIDKVRQVLGMNLQDLQKINPSKHGQYRVDKAFCQINGVTPKSYSRVVAGMIRQKEIAKWYDPDKSLSENLEDAKNSGKKVSRKTLAKYCQDMGISTDPRRVSPELWYDESLPISQNYQQALDSDIKTSIPALYRYCKEHGINPKGKK